MIKYEIFTEDKNRGIIRNLITKSFKGFTIIEQIGYWEGNQEKSITIQIFADKADKHLIEYICDQIKQFNKQDAVLMAITYTDTKMI